MRRRLAPLALVLVACAGATLDTGQPLDTSLRETAQLVPVAAAATSLVVTAFRPRGAGPFPWLVLNHGTEPSAAANRVMGRYQPLAPIREWIQGARRARRGTRVLTRARR